MAMQTLTIELKVDVQPEAQEAMTQIIKQTARDLLASASLVSAKQPMVIARTTDAFYSTEEIEILDPSE